MAQGLVADSFLAFGYEGPLAAAVNIELFKESSFKGKREGRGIESKYPPCFRLGRSLPSTPI